MCVNYTPPKRKAFDLFDLPIPKEMAWPAEAYKDYVRAGSWPSQGAACCAVGAW